MKPGRLHLPPNVWRKYKPLFRASSCRVAGNDARKVMTERAGRARGENNRSAASRTAASQPRYWTYVLRKCSRLNCKNIIKCRAAERARVGEPRIFSCAQCVYSFDVPPLWIAARKVGRGSGRGGENQRLVIKRKGRIRKRIFIILSASEARRVLAIRTQFNVSGEEKGSLFVIPKVISVALGRRRRWQWRWRRYFTALFSPRSTLHYRICHKLQEVHANAPPFVVRAGWMLRTILSEIASRAR